MILFDLFWFNGLLSLAPGLALIAMSAWALVGWSNRGDIHTREHVLDMLPGALAVLLIVILLSALR